MEEVLYFDLQIEFMQTLKAKADAKIFLTHGSLSNALIRIHK